MTHANEIASSEKLDNYISGRWNMSPERRAQIEEQQKEFKAKLGEHNLTDLERFAKIKGFSISQCEVCHRPIVVKDTKQIPLCDSHEVMRAVVKRLLDRRQQPHLTPEDIQRIGRERTVGVGGRFDPAHPHRFEKNHPDYGK